MTTKRDYYEVLGVERNATEGKISEAYRKLALQHHPDRNPGDKASEEKFKEVNEAYEVLSSTDKRRTYDQFGHAAFTQGGGPGGAVRVGDFKLIEWYEDMRVELFNLREDPGERHDLAAAMPDETAVLRQQLHAWRQRVNAAMPTPNLDYDPAAKSK